MSEEALHFHVVHVEDRTHIWGKRPRSPVLRRVLLPYPGLDDAETRRVMYAGAFHPVPVRLGKKLGPWCETAHAFKAQAPITMVDAPPPQPTPPPRRSFGRPMPTTACADQRNASTIPPQISGVRGSTLQTSTAQMDITKP
jgi:hypothetical protein